MDDIDGWPQATGQRLRHDADEAWTVTLTPEGLEMAGPERTALVELGLVHAVRQRPASMVNEELAGAVLEVEWLTSLGEERSLVLLCDDRPAAQRLATIIASRLQDLDDGETKRWDVDWFLIVLLCMGIIVGLRNVAETLPLTGAYDWTSAATQFIFDVAALPALYVVARAIVRRVRRVEG